MCLTSNDTAAPAPPPLSRYARARRRRGNVRARHRYGELQLADVAAALMRLEDADKRYYDQPAPRRSRPRCKARRRASARQPPRTCRTRRRRRRAPLRHRSSSTPRPEVSSRTVDAGVGGLRGRHDAMLAGYSPADYVMLGDPDQRQPPSPRRHSRTGRVVGGIAPAGLRRVCR